jgi:cytochrome c1
MRSKEPAMNRLRFAALALLASAACGTPAIAAGGEKIEYPRQSWTFAGLRGYYDNAQLQRGFRVYKEVCAACHGMKRIAFRNLSEPGGPQFPDDAVKALAATFQVQDGPNDDGKMFKRPAILSDRIPSPYANEKEARSIHNGAYPPDLSLIALARGVSLDRPVWAVPVGMVTDIGTGYSEGGPDYIYSLLTGYKDAPRYILSNGKYTPVPAGQRVQGAKECVKIEKGGDGKETCVELQPGMNYNTHFEGHQIGMAAPLQDGSVPYEDGTPTTVAQYSKDVSAFLMWAADPSLEQRKRMGLLVMAYLLITALLLFFAKQRLWSRIPH